MNTNWINVEDRLPDNEVEVIVWNDSEDKTPKQSGVNVGYYLSKDKIWILGKKTDYYDHFPVTHWMPLPEPPK